MARRRGSATALNASEVVAARAMPRQYILIWEYVKYFFLVRMPLPRFPSPTMYRPDGTHPDPVGARPPISSHLALAGAGLALPDLRVGATTIDPERSALLVIDMQNDLATNCGVFI